MAGKEYDKKVTAALGTIEGDLEKLKNRLVKVEVKRLADLDRVPPDGNYFAAKDEINQAANAKRQKFQAEIEGDVITALRSNGVDENREQTGKIATAVSQGLTGRAVQEAKEIHAQNQRELAAAKDKAAAAALGNIKGDLDKLKSQLVGVEVLRLDGLGQVPPDANYFVSRQAIDQAATGKKQKIQGAIEAKVEKALIGQEIFKGTGDVLRIAGVTSKDLIGQAAQEAQKIHTQHVRDLDPNSPAARMETPIADILKQINSQNVDQQTGPGNKLPAKPAGARARD